MERERYPDDFEVFWKQYPKTPIMSKKETYAAWKKIPVDERPKITTAVRLYADWLAEQRRKRPDYPAVHACRFISQRRFDGFQPEIQSGSPPTQYYAKPESPQLRAWNEWRKAKEGRDFPRDRGGGWWFPSEWPPMVTA